MTKLTKAFFIVLVFYCFATGSAEDEETVVPAPSAAPQQAVKYVFPDLPDGKLPWTKFDTKVVSGVFFTALLIDRFERPNQSERGLELIIKIIMINMIIRGIEMTRRISAMDLRKHLGKVMNEVQLRDDSYVIERDGKAMAALVPVWKLEQLEERRKRFWDKVGDFRKAGKKVKGLELLIREAVSPTKVR